MYFLQSKISEYIDKDVVLGTSQNFITVYRLCEINVKKIAFGNKEHTTDQKIRVRVLLRLFIRSDEICNCAYAL